MTGENVLGRNRVVSWPSGDGRLSLSLLNRLMDVSSIRSVPKCGWSPIRQTWLTVVLPCGL